MVEPLDADASARLEECLGAEHVGAEEPARVEEREAVVRLGGEVDHDVDPVLREAAVRQLAVADVPCDERDATGDVGEIGLGAGVGQRVESDHGVGRVGGHPVPGEVRADETRGSRDEKVHHSRTVSTDVAIGSRRADPPGGARLHSGEPG